LVSVVWILALALSFDSARVSEARLRCDRTRVGEPQEERRGRTHEVVAYFGFARGRGAGGGGRLQVVLAARPLGAQLGRQGVRHLRATAAAARRVGRGRLQGRPSGTTPGCGGRASAFARAGHRFLLLIGVPFLLLLLRFHVPVVVLQQAARVSVPPKKKKKKNPNVAEGRRQHQLLAGGESDGRAAA
jgi:hypothetical protein